MRFVTSSAFSMVDIGTDILAHIEMRTQNLTYSNQRIQQNTCVRKSIVI